MKIFIFIIGFIYVYLFMPFFGSGQIITTIAGNGTHSNTGDGGQATASTIDFPVGGAFDNSGNFYVSTGYGGCTVRKISPDGIITTVAGVFGNCGFNGDNNNATSTQLNNVQQIALDKKGNLFFADAYNNRVRKLNISSDIITTVAGNGVGGYNGDNILATNAEINGPSDIAFDNFENLYIADHGNSRVRKVDSFGIISTVAGNGFPGDGANGEPATSVSINSFGICFDNMNNLYIADWVRRIYKLMPNGIIYYYAGTTTSGYSGDGGQATNANIETARMTMDKFGNMFTAEYEIPCVRVINSSGIINTLVGNPVISGYNGDNIPASNAQLNGPANVTLDSCDNLYITDLDNYRIRKVTFPHCNYMDVKETQNAPNENFTISPNPTTQYLYLSCSKPIEDVYVCNAIGQKVFEAVFNQNQKTEIDIGFLPAGIYYVCVNRRQWGKVVKE